MLTIITYLCFGAAICWLFGWSFLLVPIVALLLRGLLSFLVWVTVTSIIWTVVTRHLTSGDTHIHHD